jgi:hypothetical protein
MSSGRKTSARPSPENNSPTKNSPQIKIRQALVASFKKKQASRKKTEDKSPMQREESSSSSAEEESPFEFVNQINSNFKFKKRRPSIFISKQFG